ncbi:uncharacterized protein LOC135215114 [Macrobrachium nipponense]|uniref:uncharacterized protein LOC135215114 n=1 Tax=Macrobrachium nipponense TaxID=159736 RepID=UPI0030C7F157
MKIMKWITLWLMVSDICISLLQIKKGAILKEHGHVKMIHDIAVVTINITTVEEQQQELHSLMANIESLMSNNQNNSILLKLRADISQVLPKRVNKRSLLPFIGTALNTLFGVATDGDVDKDRARIEKLELWAAERGTIMTKVIDATNKNQDLIVKLKDFVNNMAQNITTEINDLNKSQYVTQLLFETETFLLNHKELLNAVMLAAKNILSPYLISPSELHLVIEKCMLDHHFKPLVQDVLTYYSLISVKRVSDHIVLVIPFNNNEVNNLISIYPFPMLVNNKSIVLNQGIVHFALQQNSLLLVKLSEKDFDDCIMLETRVFVCNIQGFYQPLNKLYCIDDLINDRNGENNCEYIPYSPVFKAQILYDEMVVFSQNQVTAKVTCRNNQSQIIFNNIKSFVTSCEVVILNYLYYKPTIFASYTLNLSSHINNFDNVKDFKLSKLELESFDKLEAANQFFHMYKTDISPIMSMINIVLLALTIVAFICIVRVLVVNKLNTIKSLLKNLPSSN